MLTRRLATAAVLFLAAAGAQAQQNYPEKAVRLIVPYAAGGNADLLGRVVGQKLGEMFSQQFIIDNRAGANGVIGTELLARAAPDGYTLAFTASGHSINPGMYKVPYDPIRDFAPIAQTSSTPILIAVTAALPAKNVKVLAALAKARPGDLSYASQGNGSPGHLAGVLFNSMNGINIVHIPYKSTSQAITDLTSGQVQMMYPSATSILPHVKAGRLRAVAIASKTRSALAPEIPTAAESGMPGFEAGIWNGVLAPANTPPAIIDKLHGAIAKIIQSPDVRERILGMGADPALSTPAEFSAFIAAELKKWTKVIKDSGAKPD
ncbi:MAG: tripartite tricarboxylate transporter substrate binding protein [Betaproteobacteria bacterium]|nr:tripartite tricarboxylate transporter substrate binding protein [Betaproteobacteria bacterium]